MDVGVLTTGSGVLVGVGSIVAVGVRVKVAVGTLGASTTGAGTVAVIVVVDAGAPLTTSTTREMGALARPASS